MTNTNMSEIVDVICLQRHLSRELDEVIEIYKSWNNTIILKYSFISSKTGMAFSNEGIIFVGSD